MYILTPLVVLFASSFRANDEIKTSKETEPSIRFRPGKKKDELQIFLTMTRSLMNPLGIDSNRFIVACNPSNENEEYGFAQLRPIGTSKRDANEYDALPGSGSVENDIEEEIWDDFEKDETEFPNGFASLPWTKEYRAYAKASERRRNKRADLIKQAEKEEKNGLNQLWELASVYTLPEWRSKGIGSELIRRIIAKHVLLGRKEDDVYLLTLDSTKDWYRGFGFEITNEPPSSMALEIVAGGVLTKLVDSSLVCMRGGQSSATTE